MPLVVIQTSIPDPSGKPFRITEVLEKVADSATEALEIAAAHVTPHSGNSSDHNNDFLTARWHERGGYWLVLWEPVPERTRGERMLLM
jgi:hypothetical protein